MRLHQIDRIPWHHVFMDEPEEADDNDESSSPTTTTTDDTTTSTAEPTIRRRRRRPVVRWGPVPECSNRVMDDSMSTDTYTPQSVSSSMPTEFSPY